MSYAERIKLEIRSARAALRRWKPATKKDRETREMLAMCLTAIQRVCRDVDLWAFDPTRMDPLSWNALLYRAGERWHALSPENRDPVRLLAEIERLTTDRNAWKRIAESNGHG